MKSKNKSGLLLRFLSLMLLIPVLACNSNVISTKIEGGNPEVGKEKIQQYGCATCHEIPGVATAIGRVGPPLTHMASRTYLAGQLLNTPDNMMHWIQKPQEFEQHTAMPDTRVNEQDARDMIAYLYSLN